MLDQKTINQNVPVNVIVGIDNICEVLNQYINITDIKCTEILLFVSDKPIEINNIDDLIAKNYNQIYLDLFWDKFYQDKNCDILKTYIKNEGMQDMYLALYLDHLTLADVNVSMRKVVFQDLYLTDFMVNKLMACIKDVTKYSMQNHKIKVSFNNSRSALHNIEGLFKKSDRLNAPTQDYTKLEKFLKEADCLGLIDIIIEYNVLDDLAKIAISKML